jgi:hypothetical protein
MSRTIVIGWVGTRGCRVKRNHCLLTLRDHEKPARSRRRLLRDESESHNLVGPRSGEIGSSSPSEKDPRCMGDEDRTLPRPEDDADDAETRMVSLESLEDVDS